MRILPVGRSYVHAHVTGEFIFKSYGRSDIRHDFTTCRFTKQSHEVPRSWACAQGAVSSHISERKYIFFCVFSNIDSLTHYWHLVVAFNTATLHIKTSPRQKHGVRWRYCFLCGCNSLRKKKKEKKKTGMAKSLVEKQRTAWTFCSSKTTCGEYICVHARLCKL